MEPKPPEDARRRGPMFQTPIVYVNEDGWGPAPDNVPEHFEHVPYAPFGKSDRIGRAADFTAPVYFQNRNFRGRRGEEGSTNVEFQYKYDSVEDAMFQLVDTTKTNKNRFGVKNRWMQGGRGRFSGRGGREGGRGGRGAAPEKPQPPKHVRGGMASNIPKYKRQQNMQRRPQQRRDRQRQDRQASVKIGADWQLVEEFDLPQLNKLQTNAPQEEDLMWCGFLDAYDDTYDRITTRTTRRLQRSEQKEFYYVTTTEDPIVERLAVEQAGNVFATDAILALLMASPRSVYPWDVVVEKLNGVLFFDRRDNGEADLLTVNETAYDPPAAGDDPESINAPEKLSLEATMINQNFSQQVLKQGERESFENPNPFFDPEEAGPGVEPASIGYRYRKFRFGDDLAVVARCELHGTVMKRGEKHFFTAYALNEWDSKLSGGVEWRPKIDTQRGAILATELKNNSAKLARWTAQSILAGADQMKIGYVSRASKTNCYEHVVLGTQFYKPREFATQITLSVNNMWGIFKMLVELFQRQPDGKFVMVKDPNKAVVRVYAVPPGTFEDDDEDESDDEQGQYQEG